LYGKFVERQVKFELQLKGLPQSLRQSLYRAIQMTVPFRNMHSVLGVGSLIG
jgi:hypothetical protein